MNFWRKLKEEKGSEPILCLAPMADVTDRAFRAIIAKFGKPDVTWTEFVSADGLFKGGFEALKNDLAYSEAERPIVAQLFTSDPEIMKKAAALALELGFDGFDINMGCPDKSVEKQGAGAALIKNPKLAQELIAAAKEGTAGKIPVSVKTRIGYNKNEIDTWIPALLDAEPAVITIHARTRKEMSLVPARWEHVKRAVEIRNERRHSDRFLAGGALAKNEKGAGTLIFGNGDVAGLDDARSKAKETGCDGIMLGRAFFGKPDLLAGKSSATPRASFLNGAIIFDHSAENIFGREEITKKLNILSEHVKLFSELVEPKPPKGQGKSFAVMKKHFKAYVSGWDGAKELRIRLMDAKDAPEVCSIISEYLKNGLK